MGYCSVSDVQAVTGWSRLDFKEAGEEMSDAQWQSYVGAQIDAASSLIDEWCRRRFGVEAYVEVRSGRGASRRDNKTYTEKELTYWLWEQPVTTVTKVEVDQAAISAIPSWVEKTVRSAVAGGEYQIVTRGEVTGIRFHIGPEKRVGNIRITYSAGYATTSATYAEIKAIAILLVQNALMKKKKLQESTAARTAGTQNAAEMVPLDDPQVFTSEVRRRLEPHRRYSMRRD